MSTKVADPDKPLFPGGVMRGRHHFSVAAFWFATNLMWGALLMIVVPSQVKALAPNTAVQTQGWLLGLGAIPALIVPLLVGPMSDRCVSGLGRRRPYMIAGVAVNLLGLAIVWYAGRHLNVWLYFVGYFTVNIGNNIATGSYSGIIPDIVPPSQRGEASGWMAAMSQTGTILGVLSAGLLMNAGRDTASFIVMGASLLVFLLITVLGVREHPRREQPEALDLVGFIKRLWIDPRKYPNFAWVWVTRALVVMGLWMVQEYMQYYLVDVVGVPEDRKEISAAAILGVSLLCATVTGMLGGKISDRVGRKPVIYAANSVIAAACVVFLFSHSLTYSTVVAAIFGLGFGAYYSVDWALGCDVLPNKEDAAKDMAVWHIAFVLPQSIAQPISGIILGAFLKEVEHTPTGDIPHYLPAGYTVVFTLAAFFLLLGAVLIRNVRGVK